MALPFSVEVIETCHISPPPNSVPTTSIPLAFLDIPFLLSPPGQSMVIFEFPHSTLHFTQNILPKLKHSLSIALQHLFPLAGTIVCPPKKSPTKPYILYKDGDSSVPLTVAESSGDFDHLLENYPRDVREYDSLVQQLAPAEISSLLLNSSETQEEVELLQPLLALQVTVFPNFGICISMSASHVACDGKSIIHFLKSWASIFKSENDLSCVDNTGPLAFHDRAIVNKDDPEGLLTYFYNQCCEIKLSLNNFETPNVNDTTIVKEKMLATFVMGRHNIDKMRDFITIQFENNDETPPLSHVSRFVATCAFIWTCLMKANNANSLDDKEFSERENCLIFFADRRNNKDFYVPNNYFGNCLTPCLALVKMGDIVGENGLIMAAKSIMKEIKELDSGLLKGAKRFMPEALEIHGRGNVVQISSSPKFGIYETDFGWGKPKKFEIIHIDTGSISLTECRDEEGGIEVGIALPNAEMEAFKSIFELGLKNIV